MPCSSLSADLGETAAMAASLAEDARNSRRHHLLALFLFVALFSDRENVSISTRFIKGVRNYLPGLHHKPHIFESVTQWSWGFDTMYASVEHPWIPSRSYNSSHK